MHVILDFVVNRTSWDHPWIKAHPDWYQRNAAGEIRSPTADWTDAVTAQQADDQLRLGAASNDRHRDQSAPSTPSAWAGIPQPHPPV
jgi:glycosidase